MEAVRGEGVMGESWRVERGAPGRETEKPAPGVNSRKDSVERLVSSYNIIGRCGFGVVEVLMCYGREVVGVEEVNDSGADLDIYHLLAVYVSLLANIRVF